MTEKTMLLALFPDLDPAAQAVAKLREIGVKDEHVNVISGIPVTEAMLGRPKQPSNVPRLAMGGAVGGLIVGALLAFVTPSQYPLNVGGQSVIPGPPSVVVLFEMTMLGMLISTFLGVFLDSRFPSYEPKEYVPEISDGKIAILIECQPDEENIIEAAMTQLGAESVKHAEAQIL
ncbi:MAG: quinol:electron acceptor oxidoreductase subunit ActD [Chloroflexota bacterium]